MIINGNKLLELEDIISPMYNSKMIHAESNTSFGLTECGYDIRLNQTIWLFPFCSFRLGSSMEKFRMPFHVMGRVLNKSTWARKGVDASMTTNIEPGWNGFLTIELSYRRLWPIRIPKGAGICQIIFEELSESRAYSGKYQDQPNEPVKAK